MSDTNTEKLNYVKRLHIGELPSCDYAGIIRRLCSEFAAVGIIPIRHGSPGDPNGNYEVWDQTKWQPTPFSASACSIFEVVHWLSKNGVMAKYVVDTEDWVIGKYAFSDGGEPTGSEWSRSPAVEIVFPGNSWDVAEMLPECYAVAEAVFEFATNYGLKHNGDAFAKALKEHADGLAEMAERFAI